MKARMRTLFEVSSDGGKTFPWKGDCPVWAYRGLLPGAVVRETRTLWVGPTWQCGGCLNGSH